MDAKEKDFKGDVIKMLEEMSRRIDALEREVAALRSSAPADVPDFNPPGEKEDAGGFEPAPSPALEVNFPDDLDDESPSYEAQPSDEVEAGSAPMTDYPVENVAEGEVVVDLGFTEVVPEEVIADAVEENPGETGPGIAGEPAGEPSPSKVYYGDESTVDLGFSAPFAPADEQKDAPQTAPETVHETPSESETLQEKTAEAPVEEDIPEDIPEEDVPSEHPAPAEAEREDAPGVAEPVVETEFVPSSMNEEEPSRQESADTPSVEESFENLFGESETIADAAIRRTKKKKGAVLDTMAQKEAWRTAIPGPAVKDIRSAISLNDKVLFIESLFASDPITYKETINELNGMESFQAAEEYLSKRFPLWKMDSDEVYRFMMAVRRKLS